MDSATYFFRRAAAHLNGMLVYADLVRQDQSIVVRALGLRDAMVEPQQRCWMERASQLQSFAIWPVLDDDLDIVQLLLKLGGQFVEGLSYEIFKGLPVHTGIL